MALVMECIIICLLMWLICYLSTGTDEKNLIGLRSYPTEIQDVIRNSEKFRSKVKPTNLVKVFISNLIMFIVGLFVFGFIIKADNFKTNFLNVLVMGEVLNLFDLVVIDLIWWRNTKRIRFSDILDKKAYQDPKQHIDSFVRGVVMYLLVAVVDGMILTLI